MWKLLSMPLIAAMMAMGAGQASAHPAGAAGIMQEVPSGVTLIGHRRGAEWRRFPGYHGHYDYYRLNRHHYYYPRYRYPYYRRYYRPSFGWNDCYWGYAYWPNGCYGPGIYGGFYGGYVGGWYYDFDGYPRRERTSGKKHVKWCKARYKTYNATTDTFIGKGKKKFRCNSPYDGRR